MNERIRRKNKVTTDELFDRKGLSWRNRDWREWLIMSFWQIPFILTVETVFVLFLLPGGIFTFGGWRGFLCLVILYLAVVQSLSIFKKQSEPPFSPPREEE